MYAISSLRSALTLSVAAGMLLGGCSWLDVLRPFSYDRMPVPKTASKPGATREAIVRAGGNPDSVWMVRDGEGVCYNYTLQHGAAHRVYYVVFDSRGTVARHGYATCMEADRKGWLRGAAPAS